MNFGARLDDALARLDWSARDLCDVAGLSEAHVSELRASKRQPSLVVALAIAEVTGWTIDSLLGEDLGDPDFERMPAPVHTVSTDWGSSMRALLEVRSLRSVAAACGCDESHVRVYLGGVEPRLSTAIRYARGLGQQVHALAIGRPAL